MDKLEHRVNRKISEWVSPGNAIPAAMVICAGISIWLLGFSWIAVGVIAGAFVIFNVVD